MSNTTRKKDDRPAFGVDWLHEPKKSPPQEYIDAFAIWCEIDEVEQVIKALEATKPMSVTEIRAKRQGVEDLNIERSQLLARLNPAKEVADGFEMQEGRGKP